MHFFNISVFHIHNKYMKLFLEYFTALTDIFFYTHSHHFLHPHKKSYQNFSENSLSSYLFSSSIFSSYFILFSFLHLQSLRHASFTVTQNGCNLFLCTSILQVRKERKIYWGLGRVRKAQAKRGEGVIGEECPRSTRVLPVKRNKSMFS